MVKLKWIGINIFRNYPAQCINKYFFLTESSIEYYSSKQNQPNRISNIIRSVRNIRIIFEWCKIVEYFWIILKDKIKNNIKNSTLKIANETWILDTKGLKNFEFLQLIICCKIIFSCQKWNWNFQNLCISSDFWRQIFVNIQAKYLNIRIIFGLWKLHRIEYEYQYSEENIRIYSNVRLNTGLAYIGRKIGNIAS